MATNSIASELLSCVSPFNYRERIACFTTDDFVPIKLFQRSELGRMFTLDRSNCIIHGKVNNAHLYSLFGKYSGEDSDSVRSDTLERLEYGSRVYDRVGQIFFARREWSVGEWITTLQSGEYYGDELLLFALCRIFHRHAFIISRYRNWATLSPESPMSLAELISACDVHLVYLRPGIFGELKVKEKYAHLLIKTVEQSPPEFPEWSNQDSDKEKDPDPSSTLLQAYLNVEEYESVHLSVADNDYDGYLANDYADTEPPVESAHDDLSDDDDDKTIILDPNILLDAVHVPMRPVPCQSSMSTNGANEQQIVTTGPIGGNNYDINVANFSKKHTASKGRNEEVTVTINNTLKELCVKQLTASTPDTSSLLFNCAKALSDDTNIRTTTYPCSMKLPQRARVGNYMMELQRVSPPRIAVSKKPLSEIAQEIWRKQMKARKYIVPLHRLSQDDINILNNKRPARDSWMDIDPYSDLEDVGNTTSDEIEQLVDPEKPKKEDADIVQGEGYSLRKRKPTNTFDRPRRSTSTKINYNVDLICDDITYIPKMKKPKRRTLSGPSAARIAAQNQRSGTPVVSHPIPLKKPLKVETSSDSDVGSVDDNSSKNKSDGNTTEDEDNKPLSEIQKELHKEKPRQKKRKIEFVTRLVGIRKHKRKRAYKCLICAVTFLTQGELNSHYHQTHKPVSCTKCPESFTTPATLKRHMYYHKPPRKFCRCGQGFYFDAELRIHKYTHRRVKNCFCIEPGCGKSYYSPLDLAKHAVTHTNKIMHCAHCNYTTKDKRLLKSHQRKHDQIAKYVCKVCSKGFTYHTQWKRHRDNLQCSEPANASSPEH